MTIALGLLAGPSIVIAADTLESSQGYWKREQEKIKFGGHYGRLSADETPSRGVCVVSGTGRSHAVEALTQLLMDTFARHRSVSAPDELQLKFEETLREYYERNVVPFGGMADPMDNHLRMLIAYQRDGNTGLWSSDRTSLTRAMYTAVGIGAAEALSVLERTYDVGLDVYDGAILAAHAVFEAKEKIDGCGRDTDLRIVSEHWHHRVTRYHITRMEDVFRRYREDYEPSILKYLFTPDADMVLPVERLEAAKNAITWLAKEMAQVNPATRLSRQATTRGQTRQLPSPESPEGSGES